MCCPSANSSTCRAGASTEALNPGCSRHKNPKATLQIHWHQNAGLLHMLHTMAQHFCHMSTGMSANKGHASVPDLDLTFLQQLL